MENHRQTGSNRLDLIGLIRLSNTLKLARSTANGISLHCKLYRLQFVDPAYRLQSGLIGTMWLPAEVRRFQFDAAGRDPSKETQVTTLAKVLLE